jgi:hypothetical protein
MIMRRNLKKVGVNMFQYYFVHVKASWIEPEVPR